ncbi:unnamed protein product, partial [Staurois parvus]
MSVLIRPRASAHQCHISAYQCTSMPHISAHQSCLSVSPISASQCQPINANQCRLSVLPISASQCHLSVPVSVACQCRLTVPVSATYQ